MIVALVLLLVVGLPIFGIVLAARQLEAVIWRRSLLAIELRMPVGLTPDDINRWLNTVAAATHAPRRSVLPCPPVALEVIADAHGIRHLLLVPKHLRATILGGLRAALPGVRLEEAPGYLKARPRCTLAAEAVLTNECRQMAVDRAEGVATALLATLQPLDEREAVVVQWILSGAGTPRPIPSLVNRSQDALPDWLAGEELIDSDAIRSARLKQKDASLSAVLRVGVQASSRAKASAIFHRVWGQHRGQNSPGVLLANRWWLWPRWAASRLSRLTIPVTTWPLLLSTREASGLLPFPLGDVALPGLTLGFARQLPPPSNLPDETVPGVQLGVSNYPDMPAVLRLADEDRLYHVHALGPTGVGKSTWADNLILQDIFAGKGVAVIDPKGDLVDDILARVPEHRVSDVIVLDPAATDRPIGFNILQAAHDEQSRELVVDHVIHIWHELYKDFWGPRSEDVLRGALLTLVNTKGRNDEQFTLLETPELLTDKAFRQFVTGQASVPAGLGSFWAWYKGLKSYERLQIIGPILNKLRAATLRTPIRLMLGQSSGIDLDRVMTEKQILLVPLRSGVLGSETAALLGAVVLAALVQAIRGRIALPPSERHPFFVFVDEAPVVLKLPVELADMFAQARGLGVGFTVLQQYLGQLEDKQVRSALLGTVRNQVVFQCLREDAAALAPSYAPYLTAEDLMGLAAYEIAIRLCVAGQPLAPMTGTTLPLPLPTRDGTVLAEASRQRFGRARADVEAALKARNTAPGGDAQAGKSGRATSFGRRQLRGRQGGTTDSRGSGS